MGGDSDEREEGVVLEVRNRLPLRPHHHQDLSRLFDRNLESEVKCRLRAKRSREQQSAWCMQATFRR